MSIPTDVADERSISYSCPHCEAGVSVPESMMGEVVDCSSCGLRFRAEVPSARPNGDANESGSAGDDPDVVSVPDETTLRRIHPALFRAHLFTTMVSWMLFIGGLGFLFLGLSVGMEPAMTFGGASAAVLGFVFLLSRWVKKKSVSLILSNQRVVYREGVLRKRTSEIRYQDIRNLQVDLSIRERIFGFGDLEISSAGQDDMEIVIHDIPDPSGVAGFIRSHQ